MKDVSLSQTNFVDLVNLQLKKTKYLKYVRQ